MADKKSFLLYFDMYPSVRALPTEQKGYLFSALFEYADAAWQRDPDKEVILADYPQMSEGARMAYSFMAETIRRDTDKWRAKQARYQKAAEARSERHRLENPLSRYLCRPEEEESWGGL